MDPKQLEAQVKELSSLVGKVAEKLDEQEKEAQNKFANVSSNRQSVGSIEKDICQKFRAKSFKDLMSVNTAAPEFSTTPLEYKQAVRQLKEDWENARAIAQIFYGAPQDIVRGDKVIGASCPQIFETPFAKECDLIGRVKAFGSAGDLGNTIPTDTISSTFAVEYELDLMVAKLFKEFNMPNNPFKLPVQSSINIADIVAEGAQATATSFQSTTITFDCDDKFVQYYELPTELSEDSVVPILNIARRELVQSQLRAADRAIIDGDDSVAHMDNDVVAATDSRKAWKGLRKLALANSATVDFGGTVLAAVTKLDEMIRIMEKFGVRPRETVFLFNPNVYNQVVALPEFSSVDQVGSLATLITGALGAIRGRQVLVTEYLRSDLAATGVNTLAGPNTFSGCLLVNKERFMIGRRRPIQTRVIVDPNNSFDRTLMASYQRLDFQGWPQSANEKSVVYGINIGN